MTMTANWWDSKRRARKSRAVLPALTVLGALVGSFSADASETSRTPSGHPDLTGTYDLATLTPLQRDPKYGDRLVLSAEEVREMREQNATRTQAANSPSDPDREAPPVGGNVGGYNYFFLDPGTSPVVVDGEFRTSLIVDPPNGRLPPLTDRGKARRESLYSFWGKNSGEPWWLGAEMGPYDDPESLSIGDRCIHHLEATIPTIPRLYNNLKTIIQTPDHVVIVTEWMHTARVVRLGERGELEHAPPQIRSRSGDSIGWWEGDTLVVETTNFLEEDWVTFSVGGSPSPASDQRVVERFSPRPGGDLVYRFTVESGDFVAPYTAEYTWPRTDDRLYEYACHEGNYSMGSILRGARLLERQAKAGEGER